MKRKIQTPVMPKIETVPIGSIHFDPANVRRHPERNLDVIKASLARFGQQTPIVVDSKGVVRKGNGTLAAAKALGWESILAVKTDLSGVEATAYAIADNRTAELAEWDGSGLAETLRALQSEEDEGLFEAAGFSDDELDRLCEGLGDAMVEAGELPDDDEAPIDQAEELLAKWKVTPGQLWIVPSATVGGGEHRLLCGDSTKADDVARVMAEKKASMIVTDPPYGVDFVRGQYISDPGRKAKATAPASIVGDDRKGDRQREFVQAVFETARPHVEPGTSVYMFSVCLTEGCCSYFGLMDAGVKVQSQLIWNKNVHCLGQADYHWKHEVCWYGWFDNGPHRWFGERNKVTVIDYPRVASTLHPNEKPVGLVGGMLLNSSSEGDLVYEPFGGSGTCFAAAEKSGRVCFGNEIDPKFCSVILERLALLGLEPKLA